MISVFIAKILGALYLSVGIGMFVSKPFYDRLMTDFRNSAALLYLGGALALAVGITLITFHNLWGLKWYVVITVIGWLAVMKGITLLVLPDTFSRMVSNDVVGAARIAALILGAYFFYFGYLA